MVRWISYCAVVMCFALQPLMASGNNLSDIHESLRSGAYEKAYEGGLVLETAEGYALAAEALARQVMLGEVEDLKKSSKKARELAEKALELDQANQDAQLQHAITDGFVARLSGDLSAWIKKLPQKSFTLIEAYRETYPEDARGDALLGAWHLGVVRKTGDQNARKWFGASIEDGQKFYEAAFLNRSDDPIIAVNYAFALMVLEEEDYPGWTRPRALLSQAITMTPKDDLSRKVIDKASGALRIIEDKDKARRYAEAFLDGEKLPDS